MENTEYLKALVEANGVSGYEEEVQKVFARWLKPTADKIYRDSMGSLIAVLNPLPEGKGMSILLDAHADEIGFLVKYIDDNGYIFVQASGGWDMEVLAAQRVVIHTDHGAVYGVVGKKAHHLMDEAERAKKSTLDKLWIDIGARDYNEAKSLVTIGDFVTLQGPFATCQNDFAVSKAMDDRTGLFVISEVMRRVKGKLKDVTLYCVSAVQEEIGLRGAQCASYGINPTVGLAVDVTHTTDYPDVNKRKVGDLKLGAGPVLVNGPNTNRLVFKRLTQVANKENLPYQVQTSSMTGGTDAGVIQTTRAGVASGIVGIPLRYMHSPCEMVSLKDLEYCINLLVSFVCSCSSNDSWIPGE